MQYAILRGPFLSAGQTASAIDAVVLVEKGTLPRTRVRAVYSRRRRCCSERVGALLFVGVGLGERVGGYIRFLGLLLLLFCLLLLLVFLAVVEREMERVDESSARNCTVQVL